MRRRTRYLALIALCLGLATGAWVATDAEEFSDGDEALNGCWYMPDIEPPGCSLCGDRCHPGQRCCIKIVLPK